MKKANEDLKKREENNNRKMSKQFEEFQTKKENEIEEWERNELKLREQEYQKLKQLFNECKNKEALTNKKYEDLVENVGLLKNVIFNIQQPATNQQQQKNIDEIKEKLEKEYSAKLKIAVRDICEEVLILIIINV